MGFPCLITFLVVMSVSPRFLPEENITNSEENGHTVEEIQNAVCHIAVSELKASANATMTRQLKGILTICTYSTNALPFFVQFLNIIFS